MSEASTMSWNTELSPFASVIGTNHVPSAEELKSLRALLVHPQQELSRLETEIEQIQSTLNDLLSRKRVVLNYLNAHRALASLVRQIPPETLAEIFVHCLPTEYSYATRDLNKAPLILTTICRDWRWVALTTPRLWNSLHIFLPYNLSEDACSRRCAGIAMWLQRSGSLPLSISFHSNIINPADEEDLATQKQMELLIRSLMSFSDRFGDIFLSLSSSSFTIFDSLSPSLFPSLVSLRVRKQNHSPGFLPSSTPSHFSRMPLLRRLEFDEFFVTDQSYHSLPCNWRNLTNLIIKDPLTPAQAIAILAETPWMQVLSLLISFGADDASAVVHLNNLSEMRLKVFATLPGDETFDSRMASFTHCIECPALRLLHFSYSWDYIMMPISKWPFPLHTLETLHLSIPLTPNALTECISLTPNLITFRFSTPVWPRPQFPLQDNHLSNLTLFPENPNPLWPRLQNFSFQLVDTDQPGPLPVTSSISNAAFIAFLGSRCQKFPLKYCDVLYEVDPSFSEAELNTLHNLKQNGLRLRLQLLADPRYLPVRHDSPDLGLESDAAERHLYGRDII